MPSDDASRAAQDTPRGHEDIENTGQFPAPSGRTPQAGAGDTAQFPAVPAAREPQNSSTGQFERPAAPADDWPVQNRNDRAPQGGQPTPRTGDATGPGSTGQFALPSGSTGQFPQLGSAAAPESRPESAPLPPAGPGDGRTPLFEELESNWFRGEAGEEQAAPRQPAGRPQRLPRREPRQSLQDPQAGQAPQAPRSAQTPEPAGRPRHAGDLGQLPQRRALAQGRAGPGARRRAPPPRVCPSACRGRTWSRAPRKRKPRTSRPARRSPARPTTYAVVSPTSAAASSRDARRATPRPVATTVAPPTSRSVS
ncbi:hypothetical protein ACFQ2B_09630 [Streptomyces stramineus]